GEQREKHGAHDQEGHPQDHTVLAEGRGNGQSRDEHRRHRDQHGPPHQSLAGIDGVRQPGERWRDARSPGSGQRSFGSFADGGGFYTSAPPTIAVSVTSGNSVRATGIRAQARGGGVLVPAKEGIIGDLPTTIVGSSVSGNEAVSQGGSSGSTSSGGGMYFGNPASLTVQR